MQDENEPRLFRRLNTYGIYFLTVWVGAGLIYSLIQL